MLYIRHCVWDSTGTLGMARILHGGLELNWKAVGWKPGKMAVLVKRRWIF
jgi:hypothetical protein